MKDEFNDVDEQFDRAFMKVVRASIWGAIFVGAVWVALLGAIVWTGYTLLRHFGVV